jgi:hypothetical protein
MISSTQFNVFMLNSLLLGVNIWINYSWINWTFWSDLALWIMEMEKRKKTFFPPQKKMDFLDLSQTMVVVHFPFISPFFNFYFTFLTCFRFKFLSNQLTPFYFQFSSFFGNFRAHFTFMMMNSHQDGQGEFCFWKVNLSERKIARHKHLSSTVD